MSERPDDLDVIDLLSRLPIRQIGVLPAGEAGERLAALFRLLDVHSDVDQRGGVTFGPDGTDPDDAALVQALVVLFERRYGSAAT